MIRLLIAGIILSMSIIICPHLHASDEFSCYDMPLDPITAIISSVHYDAESNITIALVGLRDCSKQWNSRLVAFDGNVDIGVADLYQLPNDTTRGDLDVNGQKYSFWYYIPELSVELTGRNYISFEDNSHAHVFIVNIHNTMYELVTDSTDDIENGTVLLDEDKGIALQGNYGFNYRIQPLRSWLDIVYIPAIEKN